MEIMDNRMDTFFRQIDFGECFEYAGELYMRVFPSTDDHLGHFNAIRMSNAYPEYFSSEDTVISVKVRLVRDH